MGARLINNPRRTKIGHVEAFPVLHMRSLRKSAMFSEGQRTEGHFLYPGASNAITIIVDLRSEHDLKVLLGACPNSRCSILSQSDSTEGYEQVFSPLEYRSDAASAA